MTPIYTYIILTSIPLFFIFIIRPLIIKYGISTEDFNMSLWESIKISIIITFLTNILVDNLFALTQILSPKVNYQDFLILGHDPRMTLVIVFLILISFFVIKHEVFKHDKSIKKAFIASFLITLSFLFATYISGVIEGEIEEANIENMLSENLDNDQGSLLFSENETDTMYLALEELFLDELKVKSGEKFSLLVSARKEDGDIDAKFSGVVRFSSSDDKAVLPKDYEFTANDKGEHEFREIIFKSSGKQNISIHSLDDFRISGEGVVIVEENKNKIYLNNNFKKQKKQELRATPPQK